MGQFDTDPYWRLQLSSYKRKESLLMDMKISGGSSLYKTYEIQLSQTQSQDRMSRAEERVDTLSMSAHAKDFSRAKQAIAQTPDIRADKVADLKTRIEAGTYNVTGMEIAGKIFSKIS
jgi:negative regulator of flagellin synthesis FlgM